MRPGEYEAMFRAEEQHWWYRALHRLILDSLGRELPDWRTRAILDAGCGTGAILHRLGLSEHHIGVDLSPEALAFCRQRGLTNVQQADVTALPFADGTFDAVISSSVLYHEWIRDVPAVLRELGRVLRPDGVLILNLPAFAFLHSAHDEAVMTARRFRRPEVCKLLAQNGFSIRRLTYWTTLLFPLAVLGRLLGLLQSGRDFESGSKPFARQLLGGAMAIERAILNWIDLPFGVALFAIARKTPTDVTAPG